MWQHIFYVSCPPPPPTFLDPLLTLRKTRLTIYKICEIFANIFKLVRSLSMSFKYNDSWMAKLGDVSKVNVPM